MNIFVAGRYSTKVGELWDLSLADLFVEAVNGVINQAELEPPQIEAVFVASKAAGEFNHQLHLNALVSQFFKHQPPAMRIEGACASGGLALIAAEQALLSGQYKTVLVVGAEKMTDVGANRATEILSMAASDDLERGSTFPGLYALLAERHMAEFGTTREQLSAIAVKNHRQALDNPLAQFHQEFSLEQVSCSPMIASPLRLLDCSPISDGAAAVILTSKKIKDKPRIIGFGHAQDSLDLAHRRTLTELAATKRAAEQALAMARLTPQEIVLAEVHDCFTIAEIFAIEDLGFFKKGDGGRATLAGETAVGGKVVVNQSGGLKAFGHPIGATGIKQLVYVADQLEQDRCQYGLTHNVGGSGATAVVHILSNQ